MNINRRQALKSIALGSGVVISSASIMGMLNIASASASKKETLKWTFLTSAEALQLKTMSAIIIPHSSDIPGASAVSVIPFLDLIYANLVSEEEKSKFKQGMTAFEQYCKNEYANAFSKLDSTEQTHCLHKIYNLPDKNREQMLWKIDNDNADAQRDTQYYLYSFLYNLRAITIEAYMNSQLVGEKVLAYDQVPGNYEDYERKPTTRAFSP